MHYIDTTVDNFVEGGWRFTDIYGHLEEENKSKTGALMSKLGENNNTPWVCGGDFKLMLLSSEK